MIQRSLIIAIAAALLSLLFHLLGIGATTRVAIDDGIDVEQTDVVELTNAFDELADTAAEPTEPEAVPEPEPLEAIIPELEEAEPPEPEEAEALPEPEEAEPPTSRALVASANPQRTFAPDTGLIETGRRSTLGNTGTEDPGAPNPNAVQAVEGEAGAPSQAASAVPVTPQTVQTAPEGTPDGAEDPAPEPNTETAEGVGRDEIEAAPEEAAPEVVSEAQPQQLAALTPSQASTPTVTAPVTPSAIPVIPLDTEAFDTDIDAPSVEPVPDTAEEAVETEQEFDLASAAVLSSPRPRLRQPQRSSEPAGLPNNPQTLREFLQDPDRVIESPLAAYRREGVDPFRRGGGGNRGGSGFASAQGPGNSDVTNYAGEVIVHLNRSQRVFVSERGWARVYFRINPDGSLAWVDVIDGSGSAEVDRAARAQIRAAAPLPRPPNGRPRQLTFNYVNR